VQGRFGLTAVQSSKNQQPKENQVLKAILGAFGTFAALAAAIYVFGGVVLLLRLETQGLRGEVVVASLPREFLISVGLAVLLQFVLYLTVLLGAFIQQAGRVTAVGRGGDEKFAQGIRLAIVGVATAVLAVPLSRWIGFEGVPWWWAFVLAYALCLALLAFFVAGEVCGARSACSWRHRWGIPLGIIGVACLVSALVAAFEFQKPLALLVVLLAAVLTAVCLWFLLDWQVSRRRPHLNRALLRRVAVVILLAFLIFVPWRAALEKASIKGLDVRVCTKSSGHIDGLFIGENANSVVIGETEVEAPRIAVIPRVEIARFFLGTKAHDTRC
jgi:hypothetical protein